MEYSYGIFNYFIYGHTEEFIAADINFEYNFVKPLGNYSEIISSTYVAVVSPFKKILCDLSHDAATEFLRNIKRLIYVGKYTEYEIICQIDSMLILGDVSSKEILELLKERTE